MSQHQITNNQPLFVKDGKDIVFQRGPKSANLEGIPLSIYKHTESDMRVMLCSIPGSIFTLHIYVPTIGHDDKGHSHCLEHLIFCGSKRYPDRGYLDSLANCNLADGTNAWTDKDHTCYTFKAASEEALANILPVYLDHVLNPLLKDEQFVSEVYHFDQTGKEQGVVFSEMVARENDQYDLLEYTKDRLMYVPESPYTFETGGLTKSLPKLTNAEVIDYHRKFYDANNITVVITGPLSNKFVPDILQTIPREIIQSRESNSRTPIIATLPDRKPEDRYKYVPFPSDDTDIGSITFSWHGPDVEDVETIIALCILLRYLINYSSSPLSQRFVEKLSPLSTGISFEIDNYNPTNICITFGGVPYKNDQDNDRQDPDLPHLFDKLYFQNLLCQELQRVLDSKFDGDNQAMAKICQQASKKMAIKMENHPEIIIDDLSEAIVAKHFGREEVDDIAMLNTNAKLFDIYEDLGQRPIEYWLGLLQKWFCNAPIYYIAMVPDGELGSKLKAERKKIEKQNAASIVDKNAHTKNIEQAIEASKVILPPHILQNMPMANIAKTTSLPHKYVLEPAKSAYSTGPVSVHQIIHLETNFIFVSIRIPMIAVPEDLRPFLVLFKKLVLGSDILLPKGMIYNDGEDQEKLATVTGDHKRIDYTKVNACLSNIVIDATASFRLTDKPFTCEKSSELFIFSANYTKDKYNQAIRWILQAFMFADFTEERILPVAQNLLNNISDLKKDETMLAYSVTDRLTFKERAPNMSRSIKQHISIFEKESVLKYVVEEIKNGNAEAIIGKLNAIKSLLINTNGGGALCLMLPNNENSTIYIDTLYKEWNTCLAAIERKNPILIPEKANKWPSPVRLDQFPDLTKPTRIHMPIASLQASEVLISMKCDIYCAPDLTSSFSFDQQLAQLPALDYYALYLLLDILNRCDGPLSAAIRGKGYAYSADFEINDWKGILTFSCDRATDPSKAVLAMQQLVRDVGQNWDKYVTKYEIGMAKSMSAYVNACSQSTPSDMLGECTEANYTGYKTVKQRNIWRDTHQAAVTNEDLRRVYDHYLSKLGDLNYPAFTILVTPLNTKIPPKLGTFEQRTVDSFMVPYRG